jgi:hypothetical protein
MAMLGIHDVLLLIAVGTPHNSLLLPKPARRIGDSRHVLDDIAQT